MTIRVIISLVLGALATWLVALYCSRPATVTSTMTSGAAAAKSPTWTFRQWRMFGHISNNYGPCFNDRMIPAYEGHKPALVPVWSHMNRSPAEADYDKESLSYVWWNETGLGWPLCSFIHTTKYDGRSKTPNYVVNKSGAAEWTIRGRTVFVPYHPRWTGFAASTALYATPWILLLVAPPILRRHLRIKRGLCIRCGYDLSGSGGVCPECGRTNDAQPSPQPTQGA